MVVLGQQVVIVVVDSERWGFVFGEDSSKRQEERESRNEDNRLQSRENHKTREAKVLLSDLANAVGPPGFLLINDVYSSVTIGRGGRANWTDDDQLARQGRCALS